MANQYDGLDPKRDIYPTTAQEIDDYLELEEKRHQEYLQGLISYTYALGQHKAVAKHAKAIHDLGGIAHVRFNKADNTLSLMIDFNTASDSESIYDAQRLQGKPKREMEPITQPVPFIKHAFVTAGIGCIAASSYIVAPKSMDEIGKLGSFFAVCGIFTTTKILHAYAVVWPNTQKMMRTAVDIINTNERIIRGWKVEEKSNQPQ